MSTPFHNTVHVHPIKNEDSNRTMVFLNPTKLKKAELESRLVEPDPSVPCGMKLLTDGTKLGRRVGRLEIFEPRGPGDAGLITVQFQYTDLVPILEGDALAVGDTPVGGGNGFVKKGVADADAPFVAEIVERKGKKYAAIVAL